MKKRDVASAPEHFNKEQNPHSNQCNIVVLKALLICNQVTFYLTSVRCSKLQLNLKYVNFNHFASLLKVPTKYFRIHLLQSTAGFHSNIPSIIG